MQFEMMVKKLIKQGAEPEGLEDALSVLCDLIVTRCEIRNGAFPLQVFNWIYTNGKTMKINLLLSIVEWKTRDPEENNQRIDYNFGIRLG